MDGSDSSAGDPNELEAASGELTGLAQDQSTTYVPVDVEFRRATNREHLSGPRQLRDIVK
jgi:hypothetical protein